MTDRNACFAGSIPEYYDRDLGPVIFEPYAEDLARRLVSRLSEGPVLETACGTGILTRRLRALLPPASELVATDLNAPMLEFAQAQLGPCANLRWQTADAAALPFPAAAFRAVACQFGIMFVPDRAAAFREARRVLVDGGLFVFNVWDSLAHNPFARIAHLTIAQFFERDPPAFYEIPFGFYDAALITRLLGDSGFVNVSVEPLLLQAISASAADFAEGLVKGNPVSTAISERGLSLERVAKAVTEALRAECGDDPLRSPMQALVVTAQAGVPQD